MKKILLFAVAAILLASCTKKQSFDPRTIAEQCMREHAYHPDQLNVLTCIATLIPDTTIASTEYHIAAVDGEPIMYRNFRDRYYQSVIDTIYAQRDTLTDVRENIGYMREWNGWLVQQMLINYHAPTE